MLAGGRAVPHSVADYCCDWGSEAEEANSSALPFLLLLFGLAVGQRHEAESSEVFKYSKGKLYFT